MKKVLFAIAMVSTVLGFTSCEEDDAITVASFNILPSNAVHQGDTVYLENTSLNADSYEWDFGNGTNSTEKDPFVIYTEENTYTITLTAKGNQTVVATNIVDVNETPKDYGIKTFQADLKYKTDVAHGEVAYTQQMFMKLGEVEATHLGNYGEDTWTGFSMVADPSHADYNITTDVEGWDLAMTYYTEYQVDMGGGSMYTVAPTGVLINTEEGVKSGSFSYTDNTASDAISSAFADLTLADIDTLTYSSEIGSIGYGWKSVDINSGLYTVYPNMFYFVQLADGNTYKLRFTGFHGATTDERIISMEYALMQ